MPPLVTGLWWITLGVTLVFFVPLSVYLLYRTWRAARSIEQYAKEALVATRGIAANTRNLPALDSTIEVAGGVLAAAGMVAERLETIATVLGQRAK